MRKSRKEHPSALNELGVHADAELLLTDYLDACEHAFRGNTKTAFAAFEALASVAAFWWQPGRNPPERVEVPWWALDVIASGFMIYNDEWDAGDNTGFGEAFGIEGGGQGTKPILAKVRKLRRDRNIALYIAMAVEKGVSVETAVADTAEHCSLNERTVWRIWGDLGTVARRKLSDYRTATSSGRDGRDLSAIDDQPSAARTQTGPVAERKAVKGGTRSNRSRDKTKR